MASAYARATSTMYPGVWRHGDWIRITPRGGAVIYGRSDSTHQPPGRADGHQRDLPRGASPWTRCWTRSSSTCRAAAASCGWRCSSCSRPASSSTRSCTAQIKRRIREDCSPRHVPNEILPGRGGPAHALGQGAGGARQAHPDGDAAGAGGERRVARQPRLAGLLRGARQDALASGGPHALAATLLSATLLSTCRASASPRCCRCRCAGSGEGVSWPPLTTPSTGP